MKRNLQSATVFDCRLKNIPCQIAYWNREMYSVLDRKVNSAKLQDLAAEYGLTDHLSSLFRWTPEVNVSAWDSADPRITAPLLDAITTSNGRPSFTITKE